MQYPLRIGLLLASQLLRPSQPASADEVAFSRSPTTRNPTMASIDLSTLNIDQLTDLVGKAQSEMASREKQRRKDLRSELERRVAADGYKMGDIFPELSAANGTGTRRQKRPPKYRNPQNPEETWSGIGRTPKWVQAILGERGIDAAAFKSIPMYQIHA